MNVASAVRAWPFAVAMAAGVVVAACGPNDSVTSDADTSTTASRPVRPASLALNCTVDTPVPTVVLDYTSEAVGYPSTSEAIRRLIATDLPKFSMEVPDQMGTDTSSDGFSTAVEEASARTVVARESGRTVAFFEVMRLKDRWLVGRYSACRELSDASS